LISFTGGGLLFDDNPYSTYLLAILRRYDYAWKSLSLMPLTPRQRVSGYRLQSRRAFLFEKRAYFELRPWRQ